MANDAYHNSTGYFKDPATERDLTIDEQRVTTCKPGEPFQWPMVLLSNGELVKLCSRLWNADEKQCYKDYRNGGTSVSSKPKKEKPVKQETAEEPAPQKPVDYQVVKYDEEGAASASTQEIIADCDTCLGISFISGISYALLTKGNSGIVHHVPRSCIPDTTFDRLCSYAKRY